MILKVRALTCCHTEGIRREQGGVQCLHSKELPEQGGSSVDAGETDEETDEEPII